MTTNPIQGGADSMYWQERHRVVEMPQGASTIAAKVRRWPID